MKKEKFKAGHIRYNDHHGFIGCNILERKWLFGIIPYWSIGSFVKDCGQIDELVYLNNNPDVLHKRLEEGMQMLKEKGII